MRCTVFLPRGRSSGVIAFLLLISACCDSFFIDSAQARLRKRLRNGTLLIQSRTDGAVVAVDGTEIGKIPLGVPIPLKPGRHTVKLTQKGYTQYLDVVQIEPGKTTSLDIDLLPMAGVLNVTSDVPEALVYVDGKFVGTAPVEVETEVGKRTVRVSKPGYHDFILTFRSVGGTSRVVEAKMRQLPVGTTPYRPAPPPPPQWYQKWYVWAAAAAGVTVVATAIVVPILLTRGNAVDDFSADFRYRAVTTEP